MILSATAHCSGQSDVKIAVVDGKSGRLISDARVTVNLVRDFEMSQISATTNGDKYSVKVNRDDTLVLGNVTKSDGSWNQYTLCAAEPEAKPIYPVSVILSRGLETPNLCNKRITFKASPGEVVFFVKRLPFWERLPLHWD